jgi:hypothetical protein
MPSKNLIFRIFMCPYCGYTGYKQVMAQKDDSTCNLCSRTISHTHGMIYAASVDEARKAMEGMAASSKSQSKLMIRQGLGVKRRILNMVSDLSQLNSGKGVSRSRILEECQDAEIDLGKATRFLNQLEDEGKIRMVEDLFIVVQEEGSWQ